MAQRPTRSGLSYTALPSQARFHNSQARFKGFSGPVGSGKSAALCFEVLRHTIANPGRHGLVGAPTLAMLRDTTQGALFSMLEENGTKFSYQRSDNVLTLADCGSRVLFRSLDEPERLRGTNLAWFAVDELSYAKEDSWLRLEARLRDPEATKRCGFAVWTPQGQDWVYRRFIQKKVAGYECILAKPFENKFLLAGTPDYYERLESSYDPRFYRQEVLGEYLNVLADRAYHCFDPAVNVERLTYEPTGTLLWSLDFNVTPMSSVIAQAYGDRLRVIDEIVLDRATTEEAAQEFHHRFGCHTGALEVFGDASGRNQQTTGKSDYEVLQRTLYRSGFRNVRMRVPKRNPAVMSRVNKVNALLTSADGQVRLEVDPKCKELILDLEEVLFKPDTGVIDKARDPRRTHASDALGYLVWTLFSDDEAPAGERDKPLF